MYRIKLHPKVLTEDSCQFDARTKEAIKRKCKELLSHHPAEVGEPLHFELQGYRKLKMGPYRIVYRVAKHEVIVYILAVGIRRAGRVYEEALKRLKTA